MGKFPPNSSFFTQQSQLSPLPHLDLKCPFSPPPTTDSSLPQLPFALPSPITARSFPAPQLSTLTPHHWPFSPQLPASPQHSFSPPLCPRHTPHDADLLPKPTGGPLQLRSCPAWPSLARACTRSHDNPGQGGDEPQELEPAESVLLGACAVKPCSAARLVPCLPRRDPWQEGWGKGKPLNLAI